MNVLMCFNSTCSLSYDSVNTRDKARQFTYLNLNGSCIIFLNIHLIITSYNKNIPPELPLFITSKYKAVTYNDTLNHP